MDIRVRLRPWLESRLNDGWIEGLKWLDKEKGIFKIPWKHHSKQTWTEDDAAIFKDWAVVTGRFREGLDKPDWPMWKTRLRCALNKAPDIQEVKQRHNLHCEEPFKVYRFISKTESLWRANATRNASMIFDGISPAYRLGTINQNSFGSRSGLSTSLPVNRQPTVYFQRFYNSDRPLAVLQRKSDGLFCKNWKISSRQPVHSVSNQMNTNTATRYFGSLDGKTSDALSYDTSNLGDNELLPRFCESTPSVSLIRHNSASISVRHPLGLKLLTNQNVQFFPDIMEPEYHQLGVRIQHLNIRVKDAIITNPNGCCIYFGRFDEITSSAAPDPLEAQIPHYVSEVNKAYVDLLLDNMIRGIILSVYRGSIYAERMCKCAVFVYIPTADGNYILLKKLGRRTREKLFDYDQFLNDLELYRQNQQPKPHFEVILAFGQQLRSGISTESLLVWCRIASCRAWFQFYKSRPSVCSTSNTPYQMGILKMDEFPHSPGLEQNPIELSHYLNRRNVSNQSNGYTGSVKLEELDSIHESDVGGINLVDPLYADGIVTEQIIEEGVEVPLDEDDLVYDTSGGHAMHDNLLVVDNGHDIGNTSDYSKLSCYS